MLEEFVIERDEDHHSAPQALIEDPAFQAGNYTIKSLEEWLAEQDA